jgi:hypothetical protein
MVEHQQADCLGVDEFRVGAALTRPPPSRTPSRSER